MYTLDDVSVDTCNTDMLSTLEWCQAAWSQLLNAPLNTEMNQSISDYEWVIVLVI